MTGFGGDWLVPIAFRIMPRTIANLTNDVVEIKKKGAKLIDEIANSKLMDELNCNGEVNELKSMFIPVVCANVVVENKPIKIRLFKIIICLLIESFDWLIQLNIHSL